LVFPQVHDFPCISTEELDGFMGIAGVEDAENPPSVFKAARGENDVSHDSRAARGSLRLPIRHMRKILHIEKIGPRRRCQGLCLMEKLARRHGSIEGLESHVEGVDATNLTSLISVGEDRPAKSPKQGQTERAVRLVEHGAFTRRIH